MTFQFQEQALHDAEANYKNIELDPKKRQVIQGVAGIISKYVRVSELALRGFVLFSIKDTQQELQLEVKNMDSMSPMDKKRFIQTVFNKIGHYLEKIMVSSTSADKKKLRDALQEAFKFRMSRAV